MVYEQTEQNVSGLLHASHWNVVGEKVWERMNSLGRGFAQETGRSFAETNNQTPTDSREDLDRIAALISAARKEGK